MADGPLGVIALDLDHRLEKRRPFCGRQIEASQGWMVLIPRGDQPDRRQHIRRGCNAACAIGNIDGRVIPLPFRGFAFILCGRSGRNDQLALGIIALN